jgi:hypothetical protein
MANLDAPKGFKWVRATVPGASPFVEEVEVTAANKVYPGDALELTSGKVAHANADTDRIYGIAAGYGDGDSALHFEDKVLCYVSLTHGIFEVQVDGGTVDVDDVGKYVKVVLGTPDATLFQSRDQVFATPAADYDPATGEVWRIVGFPDDPLNEVGAANCRVWVTLGPDPAASAISDAT